MNNLDTQTKLGYIVGVQFYFSKQQKISCIKDGKQVDGIKVTIYGSKDPARCYKPVKTPERWKM